MVPKISWEKVVAQSIFFLVTRVRNELAQQIDKTLSNLEETSPIDIIEEGEGVLDLEEGMLEVYSKVCIYSEVPNKSVY